MDERVVSVAVPLPFQAPFSYRMPAGAPLPERGVRVEVPFGSRRVIGVVCGPATGPSGRDLEATRTRPERPPERRLKEVLQVLDEAPLADPLLLDLAAWVADHYLAPPGECYRLVLPPAGVRASRAMVRLLKPGGADDPLLAQLQAGPLRLSTLEKRLGRDPQARLLRLRREGIVAVEQALASPGFREVRVAVLEQQAPELARKGPGRGRRAAARRRRTRARPRPAAGPALAARRRRSPGGEGRAAARLGA